jgi:hypothetical protein
VQNRPQRKNRAPKCLVSHGTGDNYEVMTWDPKEKVYRDHSLWYDSADQWIYVGHFEGDTLVYHGESEFDGKQVKFRSETRPSACPTAQLAFFPA